MLAKPHDRQSRTLKRAGTCPGFYLGFAARRVRSRCRKPAGIPGYVDVGAFSRGIVHTPSRFVTSSPGRMYVKASLRLIPEPARFFVYCARTVKATTHAEITRQLCQLSFNPITPILATPQTQGS